MNETLLESLARDERSGVQKLLVRYRKLLIEEEARRQRWERMREFSRKIRVNGYRFIAGIDEAGRGPLAGPVVAAAVILDPEEPIYGLDDSKKLTGKKREELYDIIMEKALAVAVRIVNNKVVGKNIPGYLSSHRGYQPVSRTADYILITEYGMQPGHPQNDNRW